MFFVVFFLMKIVYNSERREISGRGVMVFFFFFFFFSLYSMNRRDEIESAICLLLSFQVTISDYYLNKYNQALISVLA